MVLKFYVISSTIIILHAVFKGCGSAIYGYDRTASLYYYFLSIFSIKKKLTFEFVNVTIVSLIPAWGIALSQFSGSR